MTRSEGFLERLNEVLIPMAVLLWSWFRFHEDLKDEVVVKNWVPGHKKQTCRPTWLAPTMYSTRATARFSKRLFLVPRRQLKPKPRPRAHSRFTRFYTHNLLTTMRAQIGVLVSSQYLDRRMQGRSMQINKIKSYKASCCRSLFHCRFVSAFPSLRP